jgi:hypothetical protein
MDIFSHTDVLLVLCGAGALEAGACMVGSVVGCDSAYMQYVLPLTIASGRSRGRSSLAAPAKERQSRRDGKQINV